MRSSPLANEHGYVTMSNVDPVEEMVNMISASRAYQTNAWVLGATTSNTSTYNSSTSVTVYDSLGNSHIMSLYSRTAGTGNSNMYYQLDGVATSTMPTVLSFNASGQLTTSMPITISGLTFSFGASSPFSVDFHLTGSTQYGSAFSTNRQVQDGFVSGRLAGTAINAESIIQRRYSNGQTKNLGQIVLANFPSPQGRNSLGSKLWAELPTSCQPLVGVPSSGNLGELQAGSIEESNVDLTAELVDMITQQGNYQANAQSIKTQGPITQTLIKLR